MVKHYPLSFQPEEPPPPAVSHSHLSDNDGDDDLDHAGDGGIEHSSPAISPQQQRQQQQQQKMDRHASPSPSSPPHTDATTNSNNNKKEHTTDDAESPSPPQPSPEQHQNILELPATSEHLPCLSLPFWLQLLRFLGPGFMVAMAYIDPGNLAADINQGVAGGYQLAWVTLWCSIMGFIIQILSAKLGVSTGRHLAQHCRHQYPPFPRIVLWAITELGIIAVDMIEVVGGATALRTLSNGAIPLWAGVLITATVGFGILWLERWGMRLLQFALLSGIAVMGGVFAFMFFSSGVNYGQVALGLLIPRLSSGTIPYAVGAVGAIIMPHNLYLHSDLVLARPQSLKGNSVREAMRYVRLEAGIALSMALAINIFIISVFGSAFGPDASVVVVDSSGATCNNIDGSGGVGLGNAGACLGARFGAYMNYVWGAGLLAAALASTVTSTYAGQVVLTGMMGINVSAWWRTVAVRVATLGPTLSVAIFFRSETALTALTEWLNIIQSLVLPFVVVPLLIFTSSTKIMGPHANRPWSVASISLILAFLIGMNGYLAVSFALDKLPAVAWARALFGIGCVLYCSFGLYLLLGPKRVDKWVAEGWGRAKAKVVTMNSKQCGICVCCRGPGSGAGGGVMSRAVDMMEVHA